MPVGSKGAAMQSLIGAVSMAAISIPVSFVVARLCLRIIVRAVKRAQ
jgi:hypothetical protein